MTDAPLTTGIYTLPASAYHADPCPAPSLSSSIAKQICLASPLHAWQAHPRLNPAAVAEECEAFDIGTAAHARLLEPDAESAVTVIDAPDWRTKAAKEARDAARAAGRVPLLAKHASAVEAMVAAARGQLEAHRDGGARMFLDGQPERTLIWEDDGVWCRARLDYLRLTGPGVDVDDYKTCSTSANPEAWSRSLFQNGWDIQAAWYRRAVQHVIGADDVTFRYCVQETFPPYALSVIALAPDALVLAEKKCLYALDAWRRALAANHWPGYPAQTCYAIAPPWHEAAWLEKELR
jgi:hypothetical protein